MKRIFFTIFVGFIGLGVLSFYALRHSWEQDWDSSQEELLGRQSRTALQAAEKAIDNLLGQARVQVLKAKPGSSALPDSTVIKFIYTGNKRLRAPDIINESELADYAEELISHSRNKNQSLVFDSAHGLLFIRAAGIAVGADPVALFAFAKNDNTVKQWFALSDGHVLAHPQSRFNGALAPNLKPFAMAGALEDGERNSNGRYVGLDGEESLGAWSVSERYPLLAMAECPEGMAAPGGDFVWLLWFGALAFVAGSAGIGFMVARRNGDGGEGPRKFDETRLDAEAVDFLEMARRSSEEALRRAAEAEEEAERSRAAMRAAAFESKQERWRREAAEHIYQYIYDTWTGELTGKQVMWALAEQISEKLFGATVIVYRYSGTSYSLVPETVCGARELPQNAVTYLEDARVYVGQLQDAEALEESQAFRRWNKERERHMPLSPVLPRFITIRGKNGFQGAFLVLVNREMYVEEELESVLEFFSSMADKAAALCDLLPRLLQLSHAKRVPGEALAGSSDLARGESRPS